jgi:hypothetical protein
MTKVLNSAMVLIAVGAVFVSLNSLSMITLVIK